MTMGKMGVIRSLAASLGLAALAALGWLIFTVKPQKLVCITEQNTYCPANLTAALQPLVSRTWVKLAKSQTDVLNKLQQLDPAVTSWHYRWTPPLTLEVQLERSATLFPIHYGDYTGEYHLNGWLTATTPNFDTSILAVELATPSAWIPDILLAPPQLLNKDFLNQPSLEKLAKLLDTATHLEPRVKRLIVYSTQEVRLYLTNGQVAYVQITAEADLPRQLAALQAVFHSSTMEQTYQEIDVRFQDIVLR